MPKSTTVDALMKEHKVPTVGISIVENGKLKQVRMSGSLPGHASVPENTLFNIASLTKPLTSTTVLILVSKGQWELDEPLYHYWVDPDVANDERHKKLTTRHVLTHQSGLPNWRGHEPGGKLSFSFEPGTQWKYAGEGFEYLRQALEHKFKLPFEKLVDSLLFKPLKMNDTRFYWDATVDTSLYANRYHEDGSAFELETWGDANPSNLVLTTVGDYARFGIGVMNQAGVSPAVYQEMITSQVQLKNKREWGLGWSLIKGLSNGEYALVHTGGNPGINTMVILLPQSKRAIVIFTNGANGNKIFDALVGEAIDVGKEIVERMK
ncbi:MAG TPA: serine hydrolase domain-containing protein [Cyclobacteriaceae bacterium]|nr:serine hydrolase domain-containing protein [Cyclobacteriaceae bacterium]